MPTIRRCCIVGCLSNSRQHPQLQFFQFPKPENPFHKLWKQSCHASLSRILPFKKPVVCAMHFHPQCIGGRRLTSSAVPSLRLEVPTNLKDMEQQAMVEEIERSRKCAYINAVVYEWLVRANLNPQLRGSITHGMIKEKAETAKQLIGSTSFVADNRWLNRFRDTHLRGFAQKLATNQLKPLGPSLWIPDIVQELQHLFPPTGHIANFESVPEQYINYMQQYGEYEEDDEPDPKEQPYPNHYQQQQQHQHQQQHFNHSGYDPYSGQHQQPAPSYNYDDYNYYERNNGQQSNRTSPSPHPSQRSSLSSPPQQLQSPARRTSPYQEPPSVKRLKLQDDVEEVHDTSPSASKTNTIPAEPIIEDLTDEPDEKPNGIANGHATNSDSSSRHSNDNTIELDKQDNDSDDNNSDNAANHISAKFNGNSPSPSVNGQSDAAPLKQINGRTNGNSSSPSPLPSIIELETYAQALEYLKPLEDFVLFKENFRAIGLISQLEMIFHKGAPAIGFELVE